MSRTKTIYDVFLSYSLTEADTAALVERALTAAGFDVFTPAKVEPGADVREAVWRALAESAALVAVVHPQHAPMSNTMVELGAAMAWHKSIFVVQTVNGKTRPPDYLQEFPVYPLSRLDDVVQSVRGSLKPLSERERDILRAVYADLRIPTDRLLRDPTAIEALASEFNRRSTAPVSGERLVQELIRLRKAGLLPRLAK